jgi:hypothetical protein
MTERTVEPTAVPAPVAVLILISCRVVASVP